MNRLILGDNLEILKMLDDESVDLVYLDPPFFSNRNYEVIWGDAGEIRSFEDRWAGGIDHYIVWLKANVPRLEKDWQSVLHCDWHADAYIRTEILDNFFGMKNSRNAIVWHYTGWNKKLSDSFEKRHDIIFYYAKKNNTAQFNGYSKPWESEEEYIKKRKQKVHKNRHGAYVLSDGGNGQRVKRYLKEAMEYGSPVDDVWDFGKINNSSKERIGYPTQKPEALMERIIKCASKPGDIVLDPFMGGGTTMAVADKLHRQWIGIDQSVTAVKVTELRLDKQGATFEVIMQKNRESKMLNKTFQEFSTVALTYERSPKGAIRTIFFVGHCPTLGYKTPSWLNCLSKHTIAVKVVNHEGLESVEIVRLKVNGKIKKL